MSELNVSLDLETMGTQANAAIIAIGACTVSVEHLEIMDIYYQPVRLQSSLDHGMTMNPDTVLWWMQQSPEAKALFTDPMANTLEYALRGFTSWLHTQGKLPQIWGNGVDFDNVILANAFNRVGLPIPWGFRQNNCYRTLKKLRPEIKLVEPEVKHNAVQDAMAQGLHLAKLLNSVNGENKS